jgi:carbonic anhydrase/acetyltransferase-like protein (isoleucine patch superfamily)
MTQSRIHASAQILPYLDKAPIIPKSVFIAPGVCIFGDVRLGENVSFWCNVCARGDVNTIVVGANTNIQDLCILHVTEDAPLSIGADVTVGHRAILHGGIIGDRCLIGMGSVIMDHAQIGEECLIAAGSLITEGTKIPSGSLVMGSPGKIKRSLTPQERILLIQGSLHYQEYANNYCQTNGFF